MRCEAYERRVIINDEMKRVDWAGPLLGGTYFDDEQEIGPQGLTLLRKVLADLFRHQADVSGPDEELGLAKELVALFKSGFRSEEELKAMAKRSSFLNPQKT